MSVSFLICSLLLLPAAVFALLGLGWLLGWSPRERTVARITAACYALAGLTAGALWAQMAFSGVHQVEVSFGNWSHAGPQGWHAGAGLEFYCGRAQGHDDSVPEA